MVKLARELLVRACDTAVARRVQEREMPAQAIAARVGVQQVLEGGCGAVGEKIVGVGLELQPRLGPCEYSWRIRSRRGAASMSVWLTVWRRTSRPAL